MNRSSATRSARTTWAEAPRFVPETRPETDEAPARVLDPIRLFRQDRLLPAANGLALGYAVLYAQVGLSLPLAITHAGLSASFYGYAIAINGVLIVVGHRGGVLVVLSGGRPARRVG